MEVRTPITVVLVDDHAMVREGLRLVLEDAGGITVVAEAADVTGAEHAVTAHRPAVLVLDLDPGADAVLDGLERLRERVPATATVVLAAGDEPSSARAALRAGALGYVRKEAGGTELVRAVHAAAAGRPYLDPDVGARLATALRADGDPTAVDELSPREREVLRLLALGHTNREIAALVHVSVRTVDAHRAHLQQKLRRSTRAELVRYAIERRVLAL